MAKVYLDTSVVIALANPQDGFHDESLRFVGTVRELGVTIMIGSPLMLEIAKAIERRGAESALVILETIERQNIELADLDSRRLLDLADRYVAYQIAERKYRFDLLHYASATLLGCSHLASWDREHFNERVAKRVNKVNSMNGFITLKVGDPEHVERSLQLG